MKNNKQNSIYTKFKIIKKTKKLNVSFREIIRTQQGNISQKNKNQGNNKIWNNGYYWHREGDETERSTKSLKLLIIAID